MALGGGTWVTQNKILPGAYINVVSASRATATLGERGLVAIALPLGDSSKPSTTSGQVLQVTARDFYNKRDELFPTAPESTLLALRELFKNATELFIYDNYVGTIPATKGVATITLNGTTPTTGIIITGGTTTITQLGALTAGTSTLSATFDLQINDASKDWTTNGSEVVPASAKITLTAKTAGPLDSGVKSALDGITGASSKTIVDGKSQTSAEKPSVAKICQALEPYEFNVLACYTSEDEDVGAYVTQIKSWRDQAGKKVQGVVYNATTPPDSEAIINVVNTVSDDDVEEHALVAWVAGAEAGCAVNASCTNKLYDGELTVVCPHTQIDLEDCIENGQFAFHLVYGDVRVLEDINSLTTTSEEKGEDFKSNQTMRVVDQIANDIAKLFNIKYLGIIPNDADGRASLWADIVKHHKELETMRAIENFDSSLVTVEQGDSKKSVVVNDAVTPINAMSQLYMTVVIQ